MSGAQSVTHMPKSTSEPYRDPHRWMVFSVISVVYFFVYFHRVSTSVIVPDLLKAFDTHATALGLMSSMYFYIYALEQPLVGYLTDRWGPVRVVGVWSLVAAAGCFMFGMAPNIFWASVARAFIGFGVGGVYVPAIKAFSQWFRKKEFSFMIGLLMSVGNFGAVIATTPLAWSVDLWGWRITFYVIGGITLILALVALFFTQDKKEPAKTDPTPTAKTSAMAEPAKMSVMHVLGSGRLWLIATIFLGVYGTALTLQGLWATPFLMSSLGIERIYASQLNMLIPMGFIIGSPLIGWLSERLLWPKITTLRVIMSSYIISWIGITFCHAWLGVGGLSIMLLGMGVVAGGFISVFWGVIRENTPDKTLGMVSGVLNPAPFLGVAVFQVVTGAILNRTERLDGLYPLSGFTDAFSVCVVVVAVCLGMSFFLRNKRPLVLD
jgi:sugar phosphate permease